MDPLVTFVVPCFNYGRYLADCLGSIFAQEGAHDFEVVAVDDGSADDTRDVLRSFADARLRIIVHEANRGHVATITEGLNAARGTFVARIDPDDRYRPHFLSRVLPVFAEHRDVGLVYGNAALIDERGTITLTRCDRVHGGRDFKGNELLALLEQNFICAPTVIARREAWLSALPVPTGLAFNDWYFTVMMARRYDFYYLDEVLADYRVHAGNHHSRIARDGSEERSILWLLDRVFATPEGTQDLEGRKQSVRRRVYGAQYLALADKYFGFGMAAEARRCYVEALRCSPAYLRRIGVIRRLLGTLIGLQGYELSKAIIRGLLRPAPRAR